MDDCTCPPMDVSAPLEGTPATAVPPPSPRCRHMTVEPEPRRIIVEPREKPEVSCR